MGEYRQQLMGDLVAIELSEEPAAKGRIKLPDWQRTLHGRVIGVGPGRIRAGGERVPMTCRVGEKVGFAATAGMESVYDGKLIRIMHDSDVDYVEGE